jgi:hypothetical protein
VPDGPTLRTPPPSARLSVVETVDGATREILGEILALSEADLGSALEGVLRSLTITAALTDAVLETSAARLEPARTVPAGVLQTLALDVLEAGFPVRFAPTWTPLSEGEIGLGVGEGEGDLRAFIDARSSWSMFGPGGSSGAVSRGSRQRCSGEEGT